MKMGDFMLSTVESSNDDKDWGSLFTLKNVVKILFQNYQQYLVTTKLKDWELPASEISNYTSSKSDLLLSAVDSNDQ